MAKSKRVSLVLIIEYNVNGNWSPGYWAKFKICLPGLDLFGMSYSLSTTKTATSLGVKEGGVYCIFFLSNKVGLIF